MGRYRVTLALGFVLMITAVGCATTPVCQMYVVPVGTVPDSLTQDLVRHYERTLSLRIRQLPAMTVTEDLIDPSRQQLIAEEVIRKIKEQWPDLAIDPNARLIGITDNDMFIRAKQWRFAFALRKEGRFAVVSNHRMNPTFFHLPPNDDLMTERLRKMILKQIGLQYYGLPNRQEKTSVLFSPVLGLDDLDAIAPEFDAVDRARIAALAQPCPVQAQTDKPVPSPARTESPDELLSQIEQMVSLKTTAPPSLGKSIVEMIDRNPKAAADALLKKLDDRPLTNRQLMVYVWALGITRDARAEKPLMTLYREQSDETVRGNCLHALALVGSPETGKFLLGALEQETDRTKRSAILNLLAQLQVTEALPKTEELLKLDTKTDYWESVFVFGKMGDAAVPFLIGKLQDRDRNVRANAVNVLGQWLIPIEATLPLLDLYWLESDQELRLMILSSLERLSADHDGTKAMFEQIVSKEKDGKLATFARETVEGIDSLKTDVVSFNQKKRVSAEVFHQEYERLYKSAGKRGNYDVLATTTTIEDEGLLKSLRERILQRDSDESFGDYQRVTRIIVFNRFNANLHPQ